ncbi:hypothetical protein HS048_03980 [Planomonospora sp. ID91781]|uniref:Membrane protein n=3 Tax=Planomonospora TaxID=1998 RepID=A0A171DK17_9ACTN|nr:MULTISPECIES: hypothetical protein [Planomonospora]MBG0819905.1 hypothetical protein [Planomonospora sp. ID91781]GAT69166.1 membrane protein [Planomonospora sphaerica]GGK60354.1 hypothetical protein GCM10010126_19890 [Planomonospora parontospora]GII08781.1 hypothetical protein Ppa06_25790 [Planomonospora parontospora subsp. parontospora]
MSQATRPTRRRAPRFARLPLGGDGEPHPLENGLSLATFAVGLLAFVCGIFTAAHVAASWLGLIGFWGGFYSQYVSATTPERALNIVGIVASFVGVALGIYHGGFIP